MSSDEDVLLGPAFEEPPDDSSDDDILIPIDHAGTERGLRECSHREVPMTGRFAAWLVRDPDESFAGPSAVLGITDNRWDVLTPDAASSHAAAPPHPGVGGCARENGTRVVYTVAEVWMLDEAVELPEDFVLRSGPLGARAVEEQYDGGKFRSGSCSLNDVLDSLQIAVTTTLVVPAMMATFVRDGISALAVYSIALGARLPRGGLPGGEPGPSVVKSIRSHLGITKSSRAPFIGPERWAEQEARYDEVLLELPKAKRARGVSTTSGMGRDAEDPSRQDRDPLEMLNGLDFVQYLRSGRFFFESDGRFEKYDNPSAEPRSGIYDPDGATFQRAASKLDMVDMLVERRTWRADRIFDRVAAIHLFSDSSPVTGEELQGMVMDAVYKDGSTRRRTLPGSSLCYGNFGSIAKTVALLWACFLICGPEEVDMRYWLDHVYAIVTDHGTEIHTIECPDILSAFLHWNMGAELLTCVGKVVHNRRLFPNAVRISGWCHAWDNLMKELAAACPKWPTVLEQMRTLVTFWRNRTWRKWVRRALTGVDGIEPGLFKHFTATIAKWRYGTIPHAMEQLLRLRIVCERHLQLEMFANAKDKKFIQKVMEACRDHGLWVFMQTCYTWVMKRCEEARHWGMTCSCADHVKQRRDDGIKHIHCFWNSRKLAEAWTFLEVMIKDVKEQGGHFTPDDAEGVREIWECVMVQLHKLMTGIQKRFGYLAMLPWAFSRACSVDGAVEVMKQIRARPLEQHDPLTRLVWDKVGGDIEKRSKGEPCTPALAEAVRVGFSYDPLAEDPGEGYHRDTHLEKIGHPRAQTVTLNSRPGIR